MNTIAGVVSVLMLLLTTATVVITIRQFRKQLQLNFFSDYTKRYQQIILGFPEGINDKNFRISEQPADQRAHTLRHMRAYFDLCSEEYYLKIQGHIDKDMWKEWESGIRFALSKPAFQEAWHTLHQDTTYYKEFAGFVAAAIQQRT